MQPAPQRPGANNIPAPGIAEQTRALVEQNRIAKAQQSIEQKQLDAQKDDAKAQSKQTSSISTGFLFDAFRQTAGKMPGLGGAATGQANIGQGFMQGGPAVGILTAGVEATKALGSLKDAILGLSASVNPGGMQLLEGAWQELAMTLGQAVSPVVPVISAAVLTFSDIQKTVLEPHLGDITNTIGVTMVDNIIKGIKGVTDFAGAIAIMSGQILRMSADIIQAGANLSPAGWLGMYDGLIEGLRSKADAADKIGGQIGNALLNLDIGKMFSANLAKVAQESRHALNKAGGAPQQTSDLGSIWKQMQAKSLGMSPYEREALTKQTEALKRLDDLVAAVRQGNLSQHKTGIVF